VWALTKFQNKHISELLIWIVLVKLLREEYNLKCSVRYSINAEI